MIAQEVNPASPWCQRWNGRSHSWRHTSEGGFDPDDFTVEAIDETMAKGYVVANHYSGSYPAALLRYGMFDAGELVGVIVLSVPPQAKVLTAVYPDLEPYRESAELGRMVLHDRCAANSETWFMARAFEEAAAVGMRGIVSFADPCPRRVGGELLFAGHIGTCYQAKGAVFTGRGAARTVTLLPDGTILNARSASKVRQQDRGHEYVERKLVTLGARPLRAGERPAAWLTDALDTVGATRLRHRGNYRYCFPIGTRTQRRRTHIAMNPVPYPKETDA